MAATQHIKKVIASMLPGKLQQKALNDVDQSIKFFEKSKLLIIVDF